MVRHAGEYFIDVKGIVVSPVRPLQAASLNSNELIAPQANSFSTDSDASFSKQVFNVPMAQVEAIVEPDAIGNDIWRKSVAFICIHRPILSRPAL